MSEYENVLMDCFLQTGIFSLYITLIDGLLLHKMLTHELESHRLFVDYCDAFYQLFGLSIRRHPFTAEDPLVSKWCTFL